VTIDLPNDVNTISSPPRNRFTLQFRKPQNDSNNVIQNKEDVF